ncbi:MAG: hypothetical protein JST00_46080 [Deltaproteobacteria bacterium]|nr:hypothetical protein [Deltaproteobacteria bacterium]
MTPAASPRTFLAQIAAQSAATWHAVGAACFRGEATIETGNRTYWFRDGVFVSRSSGPARSHEAPPQLLGMRLIGFLAEEGGFWSLSTTWRPGSHAVLWRPSAPGESIDPTSFVLTSAAVSFDIAPPSPPSGIRARRPALPPIIARPAPASMTRLHPASPLPSVILT